LKTETASLEGGTPVAPSVLLSNAPRISEGKEYDLYNYIADSRPFRDTYRRNLASQGRMSVAKAEQIEALSPADRATIALANENFIRVLPLMQHRHPISDGDCWHGVCWTNSSNNKQVLFAFRELTHSLSGSATVVDISEGPGKEVVFEAVGCFVAKPMRTYVITTG